MSINCGRCSHRKRFLRIAVCLAVIIALPSISSVFADTSSGILVEAERAEKAGAYSRAIDLYSTALADTSISNAERRDILKRRAFANEHANRIDRATDDWNAAIGIEPIDPAFYGSRGFFHLRHRNYDKALADFERGSAREPRSPIFPYGAGRVFSDRGKYDQAIDHYSKAISLDPSHGTAHLWRGEAHLAQKNYREAKSDFEKAVALGPLLQGDVGRLYLGLGFAKVRTNEFAQGIRDLDKALDILPNDLNGLRAGICPTSK
jgi:tetratricopeptide (TPR) repeat protein